MLVLVGVVCLLVVLVVLGCLLVSCVTFVTVITCCWFGVCFGVVVDSFFLA